jgi:hypothetical protein
MLASCSAFLAMRPAATLCTGGVLTSEFRRPLELPSLSAFAGSRLLDHQSSRQLLIESVAQRISVGARLIMEYRVSFEHSLASAPNDFIARITSHRVDDVPANIPRALLAEFIADLILKRSPQIGRIRDLRIL